MAPGHPRIQRRQHDERRSARLIEVNLSSINSCLNINLTWEADSFKDRKQLQIARGIAAHGARQTEVSENKPRAVGPLQPCNKAEEITNATPARLLPRETGTRIKMRTGLGDADSRFYCHDNQNAFRKSDACFLNY
ncbi:hypothetical protein G5I_08473 [Acromyrmex echinatior]|uniref:Uncharacterized protein n=1 Tax=Acromyrmex echinatior TaxID=103372 RepID=F4WRM0_ACREC|nr:hypothetical protein G5I_08473 [Acromyrmex echinatior]